LSNFAKQLSFITNTAVKKNILFIIGSLRKLSFNRSLAKIAEKIIDKRANISYLDYHDVPLINQDIEFPAPTAVTQLRDTISRADAVWIFCPEYNYSYPGHVKNILDWLSRPLVAGDYASPMPMTGKKVTLSGAGGAGATQKCRAKLTELLKTMNVNLMPGPQTGVALSSESWKKNELKLTEEQQQELEKQVETFLDFIA